MWSRSRAALGAAVAVVVLPPLLAAGVEAQGPQPLRPPPSCTPKTNVQAIIDDSGSNTETDPAGLRRNAMRFFIQSPSNAGKTLGAVEFGTEAVRLFSPLQIGQNRRMMIGQIDRNVVSDGTPTFPAPRGGGTDYNAAFALATSENRNAQARIFLTDGAHNEGPYGLGHREAPAPTFVIGLSVGAPAAPYGDPAADTAEQRLQRIADETKGRYFPAITSATLQETMFRVDSMLGCAAAPVRFGETFFRTGQVGPPRTVRTVSTARRFQLLLSWTQRLNRFDITKLVALDRRGRPVAAGNRLFVNRRGSTRTAPKRGFRRLPRLNIRRGEGPTFETLTVARPKRATRLRFRVKATRFLSGDQVASQASVAGRR